VVRRVGVREAKTRLSEILRDVARGDEWIITERGRPVAHLGPVAARQLTTSEAVRRLEARGLLAPRDREARPLPPPLPVEDGLVARWLREDRDRRG